MSALTDPHPRVDTSRRTQLPEEVAAYVREQIMSGNFTPGQFLRLEPISEAVGVSITPVREGLVALVNEGFVTAVPRRGFVVSPFSRRDVRDLFWTQSRLAGELAARAAKQITPDELKLLENVMEQYDVALNNGDAAALGQLGHQFHRIINMAARSDRLARLLASVVKQLPNQYYVSLEAGGNTSSQDHREIFNALSRGNARRVRSLTEAHIEARADSVIKSLEERGLWGTKKESERDRTS